MNSKTRRRLVRGGIGAAGALVLLIVALPFVVPAQKWQRLAFEQLRARTGLEGEAESARFGLFPPGLRLRGLQVHDPRTEGPFEHFEFTAEELVVRARWASLLRGTPEVEEFLLRRPVARVQTRLPVSTEAGKGRAAVPNWGAAVALVSIEDGRLEFVDPAGGKIEVHGLSDRARLRMESGHLRGRLEGSTERFRQEVPDRPPLTLDGLHWKAELDAALDGGTVGLDFERAGLPGADFEGRVSVGEQGRTLAVDGRVRVRAAEAWPAFLRDLAAPALEAADPQWRDFAWTDGELDARIGLQGPMPATPDAWMRAVSGSGVLRSARVRVLGRDDLLDAQARIELADGILRVTELENGVEGLDLGGSFQLGLVEPLRVDGDLVMGLQARDVRRRAVESWPRLAALGDLPLQPGPETWPQVDGRVDVRLSLHLRIEESFDPATLDAEAFSWTARSARLVVRPPDFDADFVATGIEAEGDRQRAEILRGRLQGPGLDLQPLLRLRQGPQGNRIDGKVVAALLDLDALREAQTSALERAALPRGASWGVGVARAASTSAPAETLPAPPPDLQADLPWSIQRLRTGGYELQSVAGRLNLHAQKLVVDPFTGSLGEGGVRATATVDWTESTPQWTGVAHMDSVASSTLLQPIAGRLAQALDTRFSGRVALDGPVSTVPQQVLAALTGDARLDGAPGRLLPETVLGDRISTFLGDKADRWRQLDFRGLRAGLRVQDGRVHFREVAVDGPTALRIGGSVGLDGDTALRLDIRLPRGVTPELGALAPLADLLRDDEGRIRFGVDVRGPATRPRVEIDFAQLEDRAREAGEGRLRDRLGRGLEGLLGEGAEADSTAVDPLEKAGDEAREGLKDLLRGLGGKRKKGGSGSP